MDENSPHRNPYLHGRIWLAYGVLILIAVPWYWAPDEARLVTGMPVWVAVSVWVSGAISCFTAWLLQRPWPHEEEESREERS